MLISIIIPVYNVEAYVARCIESIIQQTYRNLQIIVVDDGSIDASISIVESLQDERIEIIRKENGGLSSARNEGLKYVKGEYVTFVDSDDFLSNNAIEEFVKYAIKYHADIVVAKEKIVNSDIENNVCKSNMASHMFLGQDCLSELLRMRVPTYTWGKLYRTSLVKDNKILFPVGRNYEDVATSYLFFNNCKRLVEIDNILYFYRNRPGSIVNTRRIKEVDNIISALKEMIAKPIKNEFWSYFQLKILYGAYVYTLRLPSEEKGSKKYETMINEFDLLRRSINLEKPLLYYWREKNFYKIFIMKLNLMRFISFYFKSI